MAKDRAQNVIEGRAPSFDIAARHADAFGKAAGRGVYEYRYELALVAVPAGVCAGLVVGLRQNPVSVVVAALAVLTAARRPVGRALASARIRRRWDRAASHCKLPGRVRVLRVERTWSGSRLRMRVSHGLSFDLLASRTEALRASMCVAEVKVKRDPKDASRGSLTLISRDPLMEQAGKDWPAIATADEFSLWESILLGTDDHGEPVRISLPEKNLLIGGAPGAGKSAAMSMLLATAALDPSVKVWLIDGKMVELALWEDCAEGFATNIHEAIGMLDHLRSVMDERYRDLKRLGLRKVARDSGHALHFVAVDELALFTAGGDKKDRDQFADGLRDLVARGRAAGVIVVAATQKPSTDVVPSSLRDLFAFKWAMYCATPQASDTILGQGWAAQGANAALIGRDQPGVGFLLAEDALPVRNRAFYLSDDDVKALAARAWQLRQGQSHRGRPLRSVA